MFIDDWLKYEIFEFMIIFVLGNVKVAWSLRIFFLLDITEFYTIETL